MDRYLRPPRSNAPRGDQQLADALLESIATGSVTWTPDLERAVYHHSGGPGPLERQHRGQWAEATNLPAMARALRALRGDPGAVAAVEQNYRDQTDHGQAPEHQLHHRGEVEDLSVGYATYQALAAMALYLDPAMPRGLRDQAGRFLRRDLALQALCSTPAGRVAMACGRVRAAPGVHVSEHGTGKSHDAGGGERNVHHEYLVASLLGHGDPPLDGVNRRKASFPAAWQLVQIVGVERGLSAALFRPGEIRALKTWVDNGLARPELAGLLSEIRLAEQFRVVRWRGGHVAWWPALSSYNHVQPVAAAEGERMSFAVVGQASATVERSGDTWRAEPGSLVVTAAVGAPRHELVFGSSPPTLDGLELLAKDPGPPELLDGQRPGFAGEKAPAAPPPEPEQPTEPLPRDITREDLQAHPAETEAVLTAARRLAAGSDAPGLDRLRRASGRSDVHLVVAALAAVDGGLVPAADADLVPAVAALRRAIGDTGT